MSAFRKVSGREPGITLVGRIVKSSSVNQVVIFGFEFARVGSGAKRAASGDHLLPWK